MGLIRRLWTRNIMPTRGRGEMAYPNDQLVLDFTGISLNTTITPNKLLPPLFYDLKNLDFYLDGRLKKREGTAPYGTSQTAFSSAALLGLCPDRPFSAGQIAIAANKVYATAGAASAWVEVESGFTLSASGKTPWQVDWGKASSGNFVSFWSNIDSDVIMVDSNANTVTRLLAVGGGTASAFGIAWFLNRLFVGGIKEDGTEKRDTLRWSTTADPTNFTTGTSGSLQLNLPDRWIMGLKVYRGRLFIFTQMDLRFLEGSTSATFAVPESNIVSRIQFPRAATIQVAGPYLFFVDADGIWQFNGYEKVNIALRDMAARFDDLSYVNDLFLATSSFDEGRGIYMIWFPGVKELWIYDYNRNRWFIDKFDGYNVKVISQAETTFGNVPNGTVVLGTDAGATHNNHTTFQDSGNNITGFLETGDLPLGHMSSKGGPGARAILHEIIIYYVPIAETLTCDITIDGTAKTQLSLSMAGSGSGPVRKVIAIPAGYMGEYFRFKFSGVSSSAGFDVRRIIVRFKAVSDLGE